MCKCLIRRKALAHGKLIEPSRRCRSNAAPRCVNHAPKTDGIARIDYQFEIREHIFDLLALVKSHIPHNLIRDIGAPKPFFKGARLCIGTIEHRHISVGMRALKISRYASDPTGFFCFIGAPFQTDFLAPRAICPQFFSLAPRIVANQGIASIQNNLCRTVVLLQTYDKRVGIIGFKIENIANICAAPRIDALIVIANNTYIVMNFGQITRKKVLWAIGILIFVD